MTIANAKIKKISVFRDDDNGLTVRIVFQDWYESLHYDFILKNQIDLMHLETLMKYIEVKRISEMHGRNVRLVLSESDICGIGSPIDDRFFIMEGYELTLAQVIGLFR